MDIIAGLKPMGDLDGVDHPISRIETLLQAFEEATVGEKTPKVIAEGISWVQKILDEIRHTLEAQDSLIRKLRQLVDPQIEKETFKADKNKLRILRSLTGLFLTDNLFYSGRTYVHDLKAWAISHGYDYELVKDFLGSLPVSVAKARGEEVPESVKMLDGFMATISKKNGFSQPEA
jgi:hypothetical protein